MRQGIFRVKGGCLAHDVANYSQTRPAIEVSVTGTAFRTVLTTMTMHRRGREAPCLMPELFRTRSAPRSGFVQLTTAADAVPFAAVLGVSFTGLALAA